MSTHGVWRSRSSHTESTVQPTCKSETPSGLAQRAQLPVARLVQAESVGPRWSMLSCAISTDQGRSDDRVTPPPCPPRQHLHRPDFVDTSPLDHSFGVPSSLTCLSLPPKAAGSASYLGRPSVTLVMPLV